MLIRRMLVRNNGRTSAGAIAFLLYEMKQRAKKHTAGHECQKTA